MRGRSFERERREGGRMEMHRGRYVGKGEVASMCRDSHRESNGKRGQKEEKRKGCEEGWREKMSNKFG